MIVGLGNPGAAYERTPHNAGFQVIDALAERWCCGLRRSARFQAQIGRVAASTGDVRLVKPLTYMNVSGAAVAAVLRYWRGAPEDVIVVLDDADLPLGHLRIRAGGGAGGHKGLQSIIDQLGGAQFARVRLGIGRDAAATPLAEYVLRPMTDTARRALEDVVRTAADAVATIVECGVDAAMNRFNARPVAKEPAGPRGGGTPREEDA